MARSPLDPLAGILPIDAALEKEPKRTLIERLYDLAHTVADQKKRLAQFQWHDIKTAPPEIYPDARPVAVLIGSHKNYYLALRYGEDEWQEYGTGVSIKPKFWCPLPKLRNF